MDEDMIIRMMRAQAWQRAKGELEAVLATYYSPRFNSQEQFDEMDKAVREFIKHVEDNGLAE